ncbi:DUF397 domain-containing protein [Actinopolyspora mortivallis]|uniref:DUF397 domain-containing protein n=1 Tax=Actinopolyspora mortivallis TaxID=33906 RepID=A0A2T0H197_ACTMO|nr:DUF397 domain-containing protein [Actinopolyspora mortivallis]PRW65136.1 DUF397 domain-containing protein [Actinopolyspora mortivallis]
MTREVRVPNAAALEGVRWRRSSRSGPNGGSCVEVAGLSGEVTAVRDSKRPQGPALVFDRRAWAAFLRRLD